MAEDNFRALSQAEQFGGSSLWVEVTPDDDADLPEVPRALWANSDGDIAMQDRLGQSVTFTVAAGLVVGLRPYRVLETGTTVTSVVALY